MAKYICPQCSKAFIYCKGCALTPDLYKEQGFCSKECYRASKQQDSNVNEEVFAIDVEEETPIEEFIIEDAEEEITEDNSEEEGDFYYSYKEYDEIHE